jgi:hypothetical protein
MRQPIRMASSSLVINVEVDGGHVAASKPGTALGIGLGCLTNTSKSRLIASPSPRPVGPGIRNLTAVTLRIPGDRPAGRLGTR